MSEEENIKESPEAGKTGSPEEKGLNKELTAESIAQSEEPQTENMEVHHHPDPSATISNRYR